MVVCTIYYEAVAGILVRDVCTNGWSGTQQLEEVTLRGEGHGLKKCDYLHQHDWAQLK